MNQSIPDFSHACYEYTSSQKGHPTHTTSLRYGSACDDRFVANFVPSLAV